jgi:CHAD domain-containing protein
MPCLILELVDGDTMAFDLGTVREDIRELRKFLKKRSKHATPDEVHSLRTTTRRFEAAMQALALDSDANERRLLRTLAKLRRRAGKVRDLDVLTRYVAAVDINEEDDCLVQLLEFLGIEHARQSTRLHSFSVKHSESLRHRLKRTGKRLKAFASDSWINSTAPGKAMLLELRLQRQLATPARLTRNTLHPYRIQVKELRYMLQMENHPADRELIETLGAIKDAIGEWHDWEELMKIARERLPHGPGCKLVAKIQTTTNGKLKRALSVANTGRSKIQPELASPGDRS